MFGLAAWARVGARFSASVSVSVSVSVCTAEGTVISAGQGRVG